MYTPMRAAESWKSNWNGLVNTLSPARWMGWMGWNLEDRPGWWLLMSDRFQGELGVNSAPCVGPCIQRVLWLEQEEHCLSGKNYVVVALSETVKHVDKIPAIT